jgi:tryptophan 2,3-dioxygenase
MNVSESTSLYYADYLELDKILNSQHPKSLSAPQRADSEMLFIVIHQAYELWFKQILYELDLVRETFTQEWINDNAPDMSRVIHKLRRIVKILELLIHQVQVLETMTSLEFYEFRDLLLPASGFQSKQFRLIEAKLGLKMEHRHMAQYYKHTRSGGLSESELQEITEVENQPTLKEAIQKWLERMPFFANEYWPDPSTDRSTPKFLIDYQQAYRSSLANKEEAGLAHFDEVFSEKGLGDFSPQAMRSMLFINAYRDLPVLQLPLELLTALVDVDELLSDWRYRHLLMVRRMIGLRVGTGGTSGAGYLEGALSKHYIFKELTEIATFLIAPERLPQLPKSLMEKLSFNL